MNMSNRNTFLSTNVQQTYFLLTISIVCFLVGMHIPFSMGIVIGSLIISFVCLFIMMTTESPYALFAMALTMGISQRPMVLYTNMIDSSIIVEALGSTLLVFIGLTYLAFTTTNYSTFALYGLLYSGLSSIICISLMNIFFQNTFIELLMTFFSVMLFSGFIILDTHSLIKNTSRSPVMHAAQLFLDFANLFVDLVKLLRDLKKRN